MAFPGGGHPVVTTGIRQGLCDTGYLAFSYRPLPFPESPPPPFQRRKRTLWSLLSGGYVNAHAQERAVPCSWLANRSPWTKPLPGIFPSFLSALFFGSFTEAHLCIRRCFWPPCVRVLGMRPAQAQLSPAWPLCLPPPTPPPPPPQPRQQPWRPASGAWHAQYQPTLPAPAPVIPLFTHRENR